MPEERMVGAWRLGDHASVTYAADDELRALLTRFVRAGVAAAHRVVIFLDTDDVDLARQLLAAAPDATPGQLSVLRYGAGFGVDGPLDVPGMLAGLAALAERTRADGYPAVCLAGNMTWTLRAGFSPADLLTYEAAVNRFFTDRRAVAMCLYDRRRFPAVTVTGVGATHPGPLLRFTIDGWGVNLRLSGELDASNTAALPSILDLVAADRTVLVDAGDLRFVDAAGARTIVRFAASRPTRHTVVRCTRGVGQALRLVGADTVPSLVLRDQVGGV